jgi:hypothetical protein
MAEVFLASTPIGESIVSRRPYGTSSGARVLSREVDIDQPFHHHHGRGSTARIGL